MVTCPACGRENPADARFCNGCGAPLAAVGEAPREERKVVTVLFADLVGFTSRAERMDPEDVRALLAPYWLHLREELERFGGTVEKFIGDAVMALFGAPVAHEDDPERAVRAALAIRDWVRESGEDLQVRIAVNTGEALVLLGARPAEGEGMAAGDVVNTAARLQAAAPVNGILVGEATWRAARDAIEYREAEPVTAKGKADPVPVWEAVEARSRVTVESMSSAPLVGRDQELDLLVGALRRVRRERQPQLVTVVGVPGIGKSRLVTELFAAVEADPDLITWRRGRSLSYGEGVSLWALCEIVKAELGVLESDSREQTAAKLRRSLAELVPDEPERAWLERQLAPLVGLPSPAVERQERFAAWRRWVEALAERRPAVLVVDDLQWADDELLDFVEELADWATGVPLLIVCTTRPELFERRPGWGGGKRNALTISLGSLDDADTARIVAASLKRAVLPADTQAGLLARADGNPLYAEQFARMLAEGAAADALPETVQGIIAARLDLLGAAEKRLLQDAAVIGRAFWPGAVDASEELLRSLARKEFVRRERRSSVAGEEEYSFAHALVRDVAYAQIPRAERAARHRTAAAWIETLPADRAADRAEMLAHHYGAALELAHLSGGADDELRRRARDAFRDAGERAWGLNVFAAARRHLDAALGLTAEGDAERPRVLLALARVVIEMDGAPATALLQEAAAGFAASGDLEREASAEQLCARTCFYAGLRKEADEHAERALALLADEPPSETKAEAYAELARLLMLAGRYQEAEHLAAAGIELAEAVGAEHAQASLLITLGTTLDNLKRPEGRALIEQGLALADRLRDVAQLNRGYNNLGESIMAQGDVPGTLALYERFRREIEQFGLWRHVAWLDVQEATLHSRSFEWDRALALIDPVLEAIDSGGEEHYLAHEARFVRAVIRHARGETQAGLEDAERALAEARIARDPQALVPALGMHAELLARGGRLGEARSLLEEAFELCRSLERPYYTLAVWLVIAALDAGLEEELAEVFTPHLGGDPWTDAAVQAARGDLAGAADAYARLGAWVLEADLLVRSAGRLRARGEHAAANEQLERALAYYRAVRATQRIRETEALLPASA